MSLSLAGPLKHSETFWRVFWRGLAGFIPKGLYVRSLLIVILPIVILQTVLTYVFMERHWQLVTRHMSTAVTQDIAAIVDLAQNAPGRANEDSLVRLARERMNMDIQFLPLAPLPPPLPTRLFSIIDTALSNEIKKQIGRPFWLDTVGRSNFIEIRVALDNAVLRVVALRSAAYASNSHIFMLWMLGTSSVLIVIAVISLRNQIKPILMLAGAAQDFGKGRNPDFSPRGAHEVRQAGYAFIEMKRRIERAFEQRTAMLNGVSHDLRTILTRFKLSLALMEESEELRDLQKDVDEMQRMLEAYLAFARGDAGESTALVDMPEFLQNLKLDCERQGGNIEISYRGDPQVAVRPDGFKRCLSNLITNAQRHAENTSIEAHRDQRFLTIHIDDDGPGIPPEAREDVFRPFFRLDVSRNQDEGLNGTGLGLAIARDIARSHGGDITLGESRWGGLKASVRIPV